MLAFLNNNVWDFTSGKYVSFTYELTSSAFHGTVAGLVPALTILLYGFEWCLEFEGKFRSYPTLVTYLLSAWQTLLLLSYSAVSIGFPAHIPSEIGWQKDSFKA